MLRKLYGRYEGIYAKINPYLRDILLLAIRLQWGTGFFFTGRGKLMNLDRTAEYFASLGIPMAREQAITAGCTELLGGLLLALGLGSKIVPLPLIATMCVAYLTAHREELMGIFSNPDGFLEAAPFLFLLASILVFVFGPGRISLDYFLSRRKA